MSDISDIVAGSSPSDEAAQAELGDTRRTDRYEAIVEAMCHRPDRSIPESMEDEAAQEGYYRFIRNPSVKPEALLEPHIEATAQRAEKAEKVLCIHDTTEFEWPVHDDEMREHLARPSSGRQGFLWHSSIVTTADGTRAPLGTIASRPFVHTTDLVDEESERWWEERDGTYGNEKWRWFESVREAARRLEQVDDVLHVMDREPDDFQMMFCMEMEECDFLIRAQHDRNVSTGSRRADYRKMTDALEEEPWLGERPIQLAGRSAAEADETHPPRKAREATVRARAARVEIRRPDSVPAESAPRRMELTVIEVAEVDPPDDEPPVEWLMLTNRPVKSAPEVWQAVDWYRGRWVTEEFYKTIKTGCGYSDLQHRSAKTLLCALAACVLVAHHLLALRHLGRHAEDLPADTVVTDIQLAVLQAEKSKYISDEPTAGEAMLAVAKLGGHRQSNGDPGWQILGRGWQRLLEYEHAFTLGMTAAQEDAPEM